MYQCSSCQTRTLKWTGKCPQCGAWNTLEEIPEETKKGKKVALGKIQTTQKIQTVSTRPRLLYESMSGELDGVLGGGLSPGSLVLLSGEPGIGKSTLALQMAQWYAEKGNPVLYISGEEHLVDVVLFLEGVRTENYRILRALKNRFGSTDAVGLFRMESRGLIDIPNPGLEFIDASTSKLAGSALTLTIEGNRPLLIEIEALTTYTKFGYPKRSSRGVPQAKLDLLIAVMSKFTDMKLESYDVYLNIGRGFSLTEPGVDLACIAAIMSSKSGKSLGDTIYLGEVSLTGVVKNVYFLEKRIAEAVKLGFTHLVIPAQYSGSLPDGAEYRKVQSVKELF